MYVYGFKGCCKALNYDLFWMEDYLRCDMHCDQELCLEGGGYTSLIWRVKMCYEAFCHLVYKSRLCAIFTLAIRYWQLVGMCLVCFFFLIQSHVMVEGILSSCGMWIPVPGWGCLLSWSGTEIPLVGTSFSTFVQYFVLSGFWGDPIPSKVKDTTLWTRLGY